MKKNRKKYIYIAAIMLVPALALGALIIASDRPLARNERALIQGYALYESNEFEKAAKEYQDILDHDPDNEAALSNLAVLYNKLTDHSSAAKTLSKLVELKPENPGYHYDLAVNLILQAKKSGKTTIEDVNLALEHFEITRSLSPGFMQVDQNILFVQNLIIEYKKQS